MLQFIPILFLPFLLEQQCNQATEQQHRLTKNVGMYYEETLAIYTQRIHESSFRTPIQANQNELKKMKTIIKQQSKEIKANLIVFDQNKSTKQTNLVEFCFASRK